MQYSSLLELVKRESGCNLPQFFILVQCIKLSFLLFPFNTLDYILKFFLTGCSNIMVGLFLVFVLFLGVKGMYEVGLYFWSIILDNYDSYSSRSSISSLWSSILSRVIRLLLESIFCCSVAKVKVDYTDSCLLGYICFL